MKKITTLLAIVFCIHANAQYTKLLDFNNTNGTQPFGSVILSANDSILYGMTNGGGSVSNSAGTIYSIHADGTGYANLHNFTAAATSGSWPYGSIIRSGNVLYGMTSGYGTYGYGNIFSINTDGTNYKDLYDFRGDSIPGDSTLSSSSGGSGPYGTLTISGNTLYGMTYGTGGGSTNGNIFSIHTDGTSYINLYEFTGLDGQHPGYGALTISGNVMYGTTLYGGTGTSGTGVLFSVHTDGTTFTKLIDFNYINGSEPFGSVILSGNTLFGNTSGGGLYGKGTIFSVHTDGSNYKDLFDFAGSNGEGPMGALTIVGNVLYGTTADGGTHNFGNVFSIDTSGTNFTDMYDFDTPFGTQPRASLSFANGKLYGTAVVGGLYGDGVIFSLNAMQPVVSYVLSPAAAPNAWNAYPSYSANVNSARWYWGDGTSTIGLYPSHSYSTAGKYTICTTAYSSFGDSAVYCQNDSIYRLANNNNSTSGNMIQVNVLQQAMGISQVVANNNVSIYPNPNTGVFNINISDFENTSIELYNLLGEKVFADKLQNNSTALNINNLANGMYQLRVIKNNMQVYQTKMSKVN